MKLGHVRHYLAQNELLVPTNQALGPADASCVAWIMIPVVVGSSPISHPRFKGPPREGLLTSRPEFPTVGNGNAKRCFLLLLSAPKNRQKRLQEI